MKFDSPIFQSDRRIENGWANVYKYDGFQSIGLLHETRENATAVSDKDTVYRIRVKVKQPCQR